MNHEEFEELCVAASAGNISTEDSQALKAHLEECVSCRGTFADMAEIHAQWLPERPGFVIYRGRDADLRGRDAILRALTKEGAHFTRKARTPSSPELSTTSTWPVRRGWSFLVVGSLMFCIGTGLFFEDWLGSKPVSSVQMVRVEVPVLSPVPSAPGASQSELMQQLAEARLTHARLQQELLAQERKATALEQSNANAAQVVNKVKQQLDAARTIQLGAETQLAELRFKQDTASAIALLQQSEIQSLNKKLADQAATFERERQVLSLGGREIRDLIAARNLHIIDVYDTDTRGKTSPAFGRMFYTEGKSLIFYAYDLSGKQSDNGKTTFYVWGKRDGAPQRIKSLGALAKDDHVQKRWVFTTTDTKILASIDSVFVTTEPNEKSNVRPSGKPLLSAFLGTAANHP
ncbi:MAG TPA: hypothetical protein VN622_13220 [Clostridia bacterium]|nr:hypothetical protein [Clostridia bacterium]